MMTASKATPPFWVASSHVLQIKRPRTSAVKAVFWTSTLSGASTSRGRFAAIGAAGLGFSGDAILTGSTQPGKQNRDRNLCQFVTLVVTPEKPVTRRAPLTAFASSLERPRPQ